MSAQCESIIVSHFGERPQWVRCIKDAGHAGPHFASWGGAQAWRQTDWQDSDPRITTRPKGRKVYNDAPGGGS